MSPAGEEKSMVLFKRGFELFLISMICLFFELLVIRWLSSEIRIFAYFKNIPLMASLFGMGLGLALSNSKKDLGWIFPVGMLVLSSMIIFAEPLNLVHVTCINPVEHYLIGTNTGAFAGSATFLDKAMLIIPGLFVLVAVFYLIVATFMSAGQKLGQLFDSFSPLVAYSINIAASFLGIAFFTLLSFLSLKPEIWLLCGVAMSLWFWRKPWQAGILCFCVVLAHLISLTSQANVIWSPYYRVSLGDVWIQADGADHPAFMYGRTINVNHDAMEGAYDNRPGRFPQVSESQRAQMLDYYDMLYRLIGDKPRSVLVLAAGAGNDLAAALRHGAVDIDAVEIDPAIVKLGREIHPEKPYDSPFVHVAVDDARAFLKRAGKKYDLVDFAYLDSHSAFSSMSSIRLDNYIYTLESFREAAKLMKPDGIMSVTFFSTTSWQQTRLFKTISEALGEEPIGVWSDNRKALTFLAGPGLDRRRVLSAGLKLFDKAETRKLNAAELANWDRINVTTDDWPFLFLRQREMTLTYAAGLIFTLCVGWRFVRMSFGSYTLNPLGRTMFCLGAAFMLVEVKSVSQMGLLAGTTWLVNSFVIGAILLMILIANLCQIRFKLQNLKVLYCLLSLSLIGSYFMPLSAFNAMPMLERLSLGGFVLALPILFASWIFAITFSKVDVPHSALGMNLLGTLVGGALEYFSMILGISALNLLALCLYACAYYFWQKVPPAQIACAPTAALENPGIS
jgi:SAM-dependent methyltransferase